MAGTPGRGQQNGDVHVGGNSILEISRWSFEPVQNLGNLISSTTSGFQSQVLGGISGRGSITITVPKTGYTNPIQAGAAPVLNLYADAARLHGFTNMPVSFESAPVKIEINADSAVEITLNFRSKGPFNATGAFAVLGNYNNLLTSSSGT
ncbi:MAG: hypothetical protein WCJ35_18445 [Planctomycetota bacterium]